MYIIITDIIALSLLGLKLTEMIIMMYGVMVPIMMEYDDEKTTNGIIIID